MNELVENKNSWSLWAYALGSTLFISAAPFFILFFVPLDKTKRKEQQLKILLSFASGGLLGDAFLHLIPHVLFPHTDEDSRFYVHYDHNILRTVGILVLTGFLSFLIFEKFVVVLKGGQGHSHGGKSDKKEEDGIRRRKGNDENGIISVSGYLNLSADFIHNFTDGLAIGASYLAGKNVGLITTFTMLIHEIPHEIGDFAILIQSGCSRNKAMGLQLVTAVGALIGTVISLQAEGAGDSREWILPFTAGGFIYISTVSIIPELLKTTKLVQCVHEIIAMLTGMGLMVLLAIIEN